MEAHASRFEFIVDTVAAEHDIDGLIIELRARWTMVLVGAPENLHRRRFSLLMALALVAVRVSAASAETQEMLDYCAETRSSPMSRSSRGQKSTGVRPDDQGDVRTGS